MAYADKRPGNNRTIVVTAVAALHGAAIYALIAGLGVDYIVEKLTPPPIAVNIPLDPPPKPEPKATDAARTPVDAVETPFDLPGNDITFEVPPLAGEVPIPDLGDSFDYKPVPPPKPAFRPQVARPSNAPGEWVSTDDYPSRDLRQGNQGTVGFSLVIGVDGRVESCVVTRTSGHPGLDAATCKLVTKRARFTPASDSSGARVKGAYTNSVRWIIPAD